MGGVHTLKRFERRLSHPIQSRISRCVCVCKTGLQAVRICSVKEKTNQWMRVNPLTPERKSKRREGGTKKGG